MNSTLDFGCGYNIPVCRGQAHAYIVVTDKTPHVGDRPGPPGPPCGAIDCIDGPPTPLTGPVNPAEVGNMDKHTFPVQRATLLA